MVALGYGGSDRVPSKAMKWKIQFIAGFFPGATRIRFFLLGRLWFLGHQEIDNNATDVDDSFRPCDILKVHAKSKSGSVCVGFSIGGGSAS